VVVVVVVVAVVERWDDLVAAGGFD